MLRGDFRHSANNRDHVAFTAFEGVDGERTIFNVALVVKTDGASDSLGDVAWLLFDQARLLEGESLSDPVTFGERLSRVVKQSL